MRPSFWIILGLAAMSTAALGGGIWLAHEAGQHTSLIYAEVAKRPVQPMPGQIVRDTENPAWLKYHGGGPFFMCGPGDPEGFLFRGTLRADGTRDGDQMALIEKLKGTGANAIYLMAVRSHGGDGEATHNPFIDHDPDKGLNQAVLDQWETWFREMDSNGIVIFFFIYDDEARIWDTGDRMDDDERTFIRALVERFKHHKHLIWVTAEEYQERFSPERMIRIAAEIRSADEHGHPIAVHKLPGLSFREFARVSVIDQFAIQYLDAENRQMYDDLAKASRTAAGRYNLNFSEAHPIVDGAILRHRNWRAAMAGAYVMALGMDIASTPRADLEDCGRLVRFMESTNFHEMAPRVDLGQADTDYVLAKPGDSYIAYGLAETAADDLRRLGLRDLSAGTYDLRWFDPVSGATVEHAGLALEAGDHAWDKPDSFGGEAALYLRRRAP
jgi:hypothetical protein